MSYDQSCGVVCNQNSLLLSWNAVRCFDQFKLDRSVISHQLGFSAEGVVVSTMAYPDLTLGLTHGWDYLSELDSEANILARFISHVQWLPLCGSDEDWPLYGSTAWDFWRGYHPCHS